MNDLSKVFMALWCITAAATGLWCAVMDWRIRSKLPVARSSRWQGMTGFLLGALLLVGYVISSRMGLIKAICVVVLGIVVEMVLCGLAMEIETRLFRPRGSGGWPRS